MGDSGANVLAERLRRTPTFDISDTYVFPAHGAFLYFLFENLDASGSMARATGIVNLRVRRRGTKSYSARTRRDLEGHCYRLALERGHTRYVGRGTYRQKYVPFAIRGSTLIDVNWIPRREGNGVLLRVRLRLIPANDLVDLIGTVFRPIVRLALSDLLDRIIQVGREFTQSVLDRPGKLLLRLRLMNVEHAKRWEQYLETHRRNGEPSFS